MARTYLTFGDIEGKLDVLRVECTKCGRKGRYHVHRLIEKHGRQGNMMKWREMPIRGTLDCCARTASGHAAAAPPPARGGVAWRGDA
jgi:hypothetical protein